MRLKFGWYLWSIDFEGSMALEAYTFLAFSSFRLNFYSSSHNKYISPSTLF
jgi:hypothetical protein